MTLLKGSEELGKVFDTVVLTGHRAIIANSENPPDMGLVKRKPVLGDGEQQTPRHACASAQTDQHLCYSHFGNIISTLATGEISIFHLVSVSEEAG